MRIFDLCLIYLKSVLGGSLKDRSGVQNKAANFIAIVSLIAATGEATIATSTFIGKADFAKKLNSLSFRKFKWRNETVDLRVFKTLGADVSAATSVMAAADAWALAVPNPVIWALMAVSIGLGFLASHFRDKPLPDWVSHGPFGKNAFEGDYKDWKDNPKDCYKALLSQLVRPKLTIEKEFDKKQGEEVVVATLDLPVFTPEVDKLLIHTTYQSVKMVRQGSFGGGKTYTQQQKAIPYKVVQTTNDSGKQIESISYYYKIPAKSTGVLLHKWRTRAQIQSGDITMPVQYKPGLYKDLPNKTDVSIDDDQINWFHGNTSLTT